MPLYEQIPKCYEHGNSLCDAVDHAIQDAAWSLQLAWDLEVPPLTCQLTRVCGNLWSDSLQYLRAARNDSLLSHEFALSDIRQLPTSSVAGLAFQFVKII